MIAVAPQAGLGLGIPLNRRALGEQLANFLPGTITSNVVVAGGGGGYALPVFGAAVAPLSWLCIAGVLGAFWSAGLRRSHGPIVAATAIASVAFAPMLALILTVATGAYFPLPLALWGLYPSRDSAGDCAHDAAPPRRMDLSRIRGDIGHRDARSHRSPVVADLSGSIVRASSVVGRRRARPTSPPLPLQWTNPDPASVVEADSSSGGLVS